MGPRFRTSFRISVAAIALFAIGAVFVLPWFFHPTDPSVVSNSQLVGFGNRTAVIGLGVSACALALLALLARRSGAIEGTASLVSTELSSTGERLHPLLVGAASLVSALAVLLMGLTYRQYMPGGEGAYFVNAILLLSGNHASFASMFSYGPLLLYPPLLIGRLLGMDGVGLIYSYYAWVAVCFAAGPLIYAYVLNRLMLSPRVRRWIFVFLCLHALSLVFYLGAATTALRCVLPYALLLWGLSGAFRDRGPLYSSLMVAVPSALGFLTSPEMGVALVLAFSAALAMRAIVERSRNAVIALTAFLASTSLAALLVRVLSSSTTLGDFAKGAFYFPILPSAYTLTFIVGVLVLAFGIGSQRPSADGKSWAVHLGWFALALVYMIPALGRADWGHILGNGMGVLLGSSAVANRRWKYAPEYTLVVLGVFLATHLAPYVVQMPSLYAQTIQRGETSGFVSKGAATALAPTMGQTPEAAAEDWNTLQKTSAQRRQEIGKLAKMRKLAFLDLYATDMVLYLLQHGDLASGYLDPGGALSVGYYDKAVKSLDGAQSIAMPSTTYDYNLSLLNPADGKSTVRGAHIWRQWPIVMASGETRSLLGIPVNLHGRNEGFCAQASFARLLERDWKLAYRGVSYVVLVRKSDSTGR